MSEASESPFSARTVIILVLAGIVGFAAFLLLAAYAPDLRSGRDGRAHGLSTSAVGFRGLHDLLEATGNATDYIRDDNIDDGSGLTIVTLEADSDQDRVEELISIGQYQPTLIILPKWSTMAVPGERDRVYGLSPSQGNSVRNLSSGIGEFQINASNAPAGQRLNYTYGQAILQTPVSLRTIAGKDLVPVITTSNGDIVMGNVRGTETFVLADPDLLNNHMLASAEASRSALQMLSDLNGNGGPYRFELVANGFGGSANMLTLAFEPPFLALTLCILAAAILAGLQAAFRFGPAQREPRAIAFGKRALVDNSAELLRLARREHLSSERYADMTREAAVAAIGNPRKLEGKALDTWLDSFGDKDEPPFSVLASRARSATSRQDIVNAAQALHQWRKAVTHEG